MISTRLQATNYNIRYWHIDWQYISRKCYEKIFMNKNSNKSFVSTRVLIGPDPQEGWAGWMRNSGKLVEILQHQKQGC